MFDLYRNTPIGDAVTYVRPYQTISSVPLVGPAKITIFEEKITVLSDQSVIRSELGTREIEAEITDPNASFNLIHPVTGQVTGTMTFLQLRTYLYSLFTHLATQRDAADLAAQNPLVGG